MEQQVSRFCPSCGRPIDFMTDSASQCRSCQPPDMTTSMPEGRLQPGGGVVHPPWSLSSAIFVWLVSALSIIVIPMVFGLMIGIWALSQGRDVTQELENHLALVGVGATFLAHMLTLLIAWLVITARRHRFTDVLDWTWHPRFKIFHAVVTVAMLYGIGILLERVLPSGETEFQKLLETSQAVRLAISFLAIVTAPFVEELVYRGVLYPSLEGQLGRVRAIFAVALLFAVVHVPQYWGSALFLVSLATLSFVLTGVRAYTGKLLPCYVIHLLYNGVGVTLILSDVG